ncbi:MAG: outer membrane beta-barrel protein [Candidatus Erginobacter occultus]|nr:outer membrane beta-barrel protein [Candidatus Erginobacter occultus]
MIPRRLFSIIPPAALAGLIGLLLATPVRGRDLVELIPTFGLVGNYDDNIQFSPTDPVSDFYTQISPGLGLRLNFPVFPVEADYTYTRYQYRKESELNRNYHYLSILVPQGLQVGRNLTIKIQDKYELVPVDVTIPDDQPDNLTQRNTFSISPVWEGRLSRKLKLAAGYEFFRVDYTSSRFSGDNYFGHRFFNRLNYEIERNLTCFQRNTYRIKDFSRAPDYTEFVPDAGVEVGLGPRASLSASGGYSFEETGGQRNNGYIYEIAGKWSATARLDLEAKFQRRRTVDIEAEPYTERFYELALRYQPVKKLVLESYARYYDNTIRGTDYRRIGLKAGMTYRLNRWSSLNCGYLRYQTVDTPSEEEAVANRVYAGINISFGDW